MIIKHMKTSTTKKRESRISAVKQLKLAALGWGGNSPPVLLCRAYCRSTRFRWLVPAKWHSSLRTH